MKLGKDNGCVHSDRIDLDLSPSSLDSLACLAKEKAMEADNYHSQGMWRELKDYLESRYEDWRDAREKKRDEERK